MPKLMRVADRTTPMTLRANTHLAPVDVAYETYGTYDGSNAIFICHPLTCDAHVAANGPQDSPGWWDVMVGPGRPIDTRRYFVICANVLGGCSGTTGAASLAVDDSPWGARFPDVEIADMVTVHRRLLAALGIDRLHAVVGASMGGCQALQWLLDHPGDADRFVVIAGTARPSADNRAWNAVARHAILSDPDHRGGAYVPGSGPRAGLATARMIGHLTYLSEAELERRFGPSATGSRRGPQALGSYLDHQGGKFVRRFDANAYLTLLGAVDRFDAFSRPTAVTTMLRPPRVLLVSLRGDRRFSREHSAHIAAELAARGVEAAHHHETGSDLGHDAAVLDQPELAAHIAEFLDMETIHNSPRTGHES
ncbi:homoserine O-acetyltransferase [Streptomyces sp. NBC_00435]|uniref:homoserine O-acetyltransferase MetX n=1 Tax=Streptomyces sp. NBC_00435 TaxID=2903649 RepID=UPI002E1CBA1F